MEKTKVPVSITVLLASYNEEQNVERVLLGLYQELVKHPAIDFEIFAYNDKSTDQTGAIIDRIARLDTRIIPVHNSVNLGLGGILRDGIERAAKEKIIFLPGDGQFEIDEIPPLLQSADGTDLLITYYQNYYIRPILRRFLSYLFHIIVWKMFRIHYHYLNWIHVYRKAIFRNIDITSDRFTISAEIVIKAHRLGYTIREVPGHLPERIAGVSNAMKLSSIFNAALQMLKLWLVVMILQRGKYRKR